MGSASENSKTLVVGLGMVGRSLCRFLRQRGESVIGNDANRELDAAQELAALGVELLLGSHPGSVPAGVTRVVVSPGVPRLALLEDAEARGIPVEGELNLAAPHLHGQVIAITGTNGKSTVTSLVGEMCRSLDRPLFVGGNLGRPILEAVGTGAAGADGVVVLELSSFQLERLGVFRPNIAAILNVSDDHLDRYADFAHYAETKAALTTNQQLDDVLVIPARQDLAAAIKKTASFSGARARVLGFGGSDGDVRVDGAVLQNGKSGLSLPVDQVRLQGAHNVDNACAAALIAREAGVGAGAIASVLRQYAGLPHRMALVDTVDRVTFVNDSKATNVGAAVAAIEGAQLPSNSRVVLIAGGRDKGGTYAPLVKAARNNARAVVVLGEAAERISAAVAQAVPVLRAQSLEEAVGLAAKSAKPGDMVLLAPACSSYDMFRSYVARGEAFERAVRALKVRAQQRGAS